MPSDMAEDSRPLPTTSFEAPTSSARKGQTSEAEVNPELITIPTLHLHGLEDHYLESGRSQLHSYYDLNVSRLCEIDYHHAMPWAKSDTEQLANHIRNMYDEFKPWLWMSGGYMTTSARVPLLHC